MVTKTLASRLAPGALLAIGLTCLAGQASAVNLVQNGGFETGDFTGWTQIGNTTFNGVQCVTAVAEGKCDAFFGPLGSSGGIQELLATTVGSSYLVSFVLTGDGTGGTFTADFGSGTLLSLASVAAGAKIYSFASVATTANTLLKFQFRDDAGFVELDAVQVAAAIPEPSTVALTGLGLAGLAAWRRRAMR